MIDRRPSSWLPGDKLKFADCRVPDFVGRASDSEVQDDEEDLDILSIPDSFEMGDIVCHLHDFNVSCVLRCILLNTTKTHRVRPVISPRLDCITSVDRQWTASCIANNILTLSRYIYSMEDTF
jgi:hypothetical protein